MNSRSVLRHSLLGGAIAVFGLSSSLVSANQWETRGYLENSTHVRESVGLSRFRNRIQFEFNRDLGNRGIFSDVNINGTFRASYDGVYDLNDDEFGDDSGDSLRFPAPGNPAFFDFLNGGASPFVPPTDISYVGTFGPGALGLDGAIPLPGANPMIGGTAIVNNPNEGLKFLGEGVHDTPRGGGVLAYPSRPCDDLSLIHI